MEEYAKKIDRLVREKTAEPVENSSIDHASILLERMFDHAEASVRIFSGKLNKLAYGRAEVLAAAERFLWDESHQLRIVIEENMDEDHPFREILKRPNVHLSKINPVYAANIKFHFSLMDDCGYRYEGDKTKPGAIAVFGASDTGKKLADIFDMLEGSSEAIAIH